MLNKKENLNKPLITSIPSIYFLLMISLIFLSKVTGIVNRRFSSYGNPVKETSSSNVCAESLGYISWNCKKNQKNFYTVDCYVMLLEAIETCNLNHCEVMSDRTGEHCEENTKNIQSKLNAITKQLKPCNITKEFLFYEMERKRYASTIHQNIMLFQKCSSLVSSEQVKTLQEDENILICN